MATVECMSRMLEERRQMRTADLLQCSTVLFNGFIGTPKGAVPTSDEAMRLIQREEDSKRFQVVAEQEATVEGEASSTKSTTKRFDRERSIRNEMMPR